MRCGSTRGNHRFCSVRFRGSIWVTHPRLYRPKHGRSIVLINRSTLPEPYAMKVMSTSSPTSAEVSQKPFRVPSPHGTLVAAILIS